MSAFSGKKPLLCEKTTNMLFTTNDTSVTYPVLVVEVINAEHLLTADRGAPKHYQI